MSPEKAVARYLRDRSRANRDVVVVRHQYLCQRGARKFVRPRTDRADLLQVAAIGLLKATDRYDARFTTPFEAYAWLLIVGELMHYVRDHERIIRAPRSMQSLEKRYIAATDALSMRLARRPTMREIAAEMSVDVPVVEDIRSFRKRAQMVSIDAKPGGTMPQTHVVAMGPSQEDRVGIMIAIGELAERERAIVLGTFASGLSQAELGRRLGLSQSQISKLMKKALVKIQQAVA
ncbi:MAG: sigma-70 family RNA polymerase sigma factor [Candidatus Velthaea sp.]